MIFEEALLLSEPFDQVLDRVKESFAAEGFGTLTEVDLQSTLKAKLGRDMPRHVIVGACNPHLAARALDVLPEIGVLLPCNVCVRETDKGVMVEAMDPGLMSSISGDEAIQPIADEARQLINNALARLS